MSGLRAALCSVGDELLAGKHPDLNAPFLARELQALGVEVGEVAVVGDDEQAIAAAVTRLASGAELVFVTGGLGPTLDDVTRHGVARAAGVALTLDPEAHDQVTAWYRTSGREMPASNSRQALVPEGAFEELAWYFGRNLHDHIAAAARNLSGAEPSFPERALHHDGLSETSVEELRVQARDRGMEFLRELNALAARLSKEDGARGEGTHSVTIGFYYDTDAFSEGRSRKAPEARQQS